jgi:hypothetical protein
MKYLTKYEYSCPFGSPRHVWTLRGPKGGIHLHITVTENYGPSGGIEFHHRVPPEYMQDDAPHEKCSVIAGPCWHDGSSMYATEHWIPLWEASPHDHEGMFRRLEMEYEDRFNKEEEEDK